MQPMYLVVSPNFLFNKGKGCRRHFRKDALCFMLHRSVCVFLHGIVFVFWLPFLCAGSVC